MNNKIELFDGKYSVVNNNGILTVYRHGEEWKEKSKDYIGDGFVLSLVEKIEELEEKLDLIMEIDLTTLRMLSGMQSETYLTDQIIKEIKKAYRNYDTLKIYGK